jgi:hypothetical protein
MEAMAAAEEVQDAFPAFLAAGLRDKGIAEAPDKAMGMQLLLIQVVVAVVPDKLASAELPVLLAAVALNQVLTEPLHFMQAVERALQMALHPLVAEQAAVATMGQEGQDKTGLPIEVVVVELARLAATAAPASSS